MDIEVNESLMNYFKLLKYNLYIQKINPFKNQDYYALKSKYNHNNLFEDDLFPASKSSLFYSKDPPEDITWLRPHVCPQCIFRIKLLDY